MVRGTLTAVTVTASLISWPVSPQSCGGAAAGGLVVPSSAVIAEGGLGCAKDPPKRVDQFVKSQLRFDKS